MRPGARPERWWKPACVRLAWGYDQPMVAQEPGTASTLQGRLGPDFVKLWLAQGVSNLGDGVYLTALPLLSATLTRDPLPVSAVMFAEWLAAVRAAGRCWTAGSGAGSCGWSTPPAWSWSAASPPPCWPAGRRPSSAAATRRPPRGAGLLAGERRACFGGQVDERFAADVDEHAFDGAADERPGRVACVIVADGLGPGASDDQAAAAESELAGLGLDRVLADLLV